MKATKLAGILGYQLDFTRHAASRSLRRYLEGGPLGPAGLTALLVVADRPGCNQTMLGRTLCGNRSLGMKIASQLEEEGLIARGEGSDRRSKGLYITDRGRRALDATLVRHARAEAVLAARLSPAERATLLRLLAKVCQAVNDDEKRVRPKATAPPAETRNHETAPT